MSLADTESHRVKTQKEVAARLGVVESAVTAWMHRGAPGPDADGFFDVAAIAEWRANTLQPKGSAPQPAALAESKQREAEARARHWQLRVEQAEGRLVEAAEVRAAIIEHYTHARALIVDLPGRLLAQVELKSGSKARAMELLRDVCDTFLDSMAAAIRAVDRTSEETAVRHASATAGRKAKTRQQR